MTVEAPSANESPSLPSGRISVSEPCEPPLAAGTTAAAAAGAGATAAGAGAGAAGTDGEPAGAAGAGAAGAGAAEAGAAVMSWPHEPQNLKFGGTDEPQFGQSDF